MSPRDTYVLFTRVTDARHERPVLLCESYLLKSQYFRKFHS